MAVDGEDQRVEFGVSKHFEYRCNTIDHGIIDGRNTSVRTAPPDAFSLQDPFERNITVALESCNRTIVSPYFSLLKLIGWRKLSSTTALQESSSVKAFNYTFPFVAFSIMLITFSQQVLWCFDRAVVYIPESNGSFVFIECETHLVSAYVLPDMIILASYLFGLYTFRYVHPEHLVTLIEKSNSNFVGVFTLYCFPWKILTENLLFWLRMLLLIGIILMLYSVAVNVLRMKSLRLLDRDTYIAWFTSYNETYLTELYNMGDPPPPELLGLRISFFIISLIGLALTDFYYIATIINYALQCQLIFCAINVTVNRLSNSHVEVDDAIKEIKTLQDFLKVLNGKFSSLVSLQLFVFTGGVISTFREARSLDEREVFAIVTGICGVLEWSIFIAVVVVQAVRVTSACTKIKHLGLSIRTRPFVHMQGKQLDLDSFLLFTSSITMDARLVHIPMKTQLVMPVLFAFIIWSTFSMNFVKWI